MRSLKEYYVARSKREKVLICIVALLALGVLFYYLVVTVALDDKGVESELREKSLLLRKFQALISREKSIKTQSTGPWEGMNLIRTATEGQVFAEVPRLLKKISARSDLVLSKSNITNKEVLCSDPTLLRLEITLEVEAVPKVEKLQKFLYQLEQNEEFVCYIKELKLEGSESGSGLKATTKLDTFALVERK